MDDKATPREVGCNEGLGPLPEVCYLGDDVSYGYDACDMREYAAAEVLRAKAADAAEIAELKEAYALLFKAHAAERERINALMAAIRAHWIKANGEDSLSVSALDVIAGVIADGSYVERAERPA